MNKLTNEQRIKNVIERKPIDFLPSQITFSDRTRDKAISEALGLDSPDQLDAYLQNHIGFGLTKYDECLFLRNDIELMRKLEKDGWVGLDEEGKTVYDCWGMGVLIGEDGFFTNYGILKGDKARNERARKYLPKMVDQSVMDMDLADAIKAYKAPDPFKPGLWDDVDAAFEANKNGDLYLIPSGYFGVYERGYAIMGFDNIMCESMLNPSLVEELLTKITDFKIEMAKQALAHGAQSLQVGDDLGTQCSTILSPDAFRTLLLPQLKRLFAVAKSAGVPQFMHSCGWMINFLPELIDIGLDVWEPVQPCNDLKMLKREYGKDLVFWGGIDTQSLPFLKPDQVKEMARDAIRILGKGGGHIIGPSQEIMNDVPLENVIAVVETIVEERERAM